MAQHIDENRKAIHEASHIVVAKVFDKDFFLRYITLSPEKIKEKAPDTVNTLGLSGIEPKSQDSSLRGFVLWAGMVGEQILKDGANKVLEDREAIITSPEQHLDTTIG